MILWVLRKDILLQKCSSNTTVQKWGPGSKIFVVHDILPQHEYRTFNYTADAERQSYLEINFPVNLRSLIISGFGVGIFTFLWVSMQYVEPKLLKQQI